MSEKKKFYKKPVFWIIVAVIVAVVGIAAYQIKQERDAKEGRALVSSLLKEKVDGVTYTLKSVEVTNERNEFEDKQPKYVVKVIYHVKNETGDELTIGNDSNVYDPDNNKLEEYAIDGTMLDSLADGKEADVTVGYSADKLGSFELQFRPSGDDADPVKFTADVQ